MSNVSFSYHPMFMKGYKKLCKKFPTFCDDLKDLEDVLSILPRGPSPTHFIQISNVGTSQFTFIKCRKIAIKSAKKDRSVRIVYAYDTSSNRIEFIEFVEVYYKSDQTNHSHARIKDLYMGETMLPSTGASDTLTDT